MNRYLNHSKLNIHTLNNITSKYHPIVLIKLNIILRYKFRDFSIPSTIHESRIQHHRNSNKNITIPVEKNSTLKNRYTFQNLSALFARIARTNSRVGSSRATNATRMSLVISPAGILIPVSGKWRDNSDTCVAVNPNLCRPSSRCRGLCRRRSHCWRHQRIGDNLLPPPPRAADAPCTADRNCGDHCVAVNCSRIEAMGITGEIKTPNGGELDNIFFVVSCGRSLKFRMATAENVITVYRFARTRGS